MLTSSRYTSLHLRLVWLRSGMALLTFLAVITAACAADMYPRQPGIRILKYSFDLVLGDQSDELTMKDTIAIEVLTDGVGGIDLDLCQVITAPRAPDRWNPCMVPPPHAPRGQQAPAFSPAPSSVGFGMTVTEVTIGDRVLQFRHQNDRLHINFAQPAKAGQKLTFTVSYHGKPAAGLFIGRNKYGDRVFFTDNWPNRARNWLATIDHIAVKAPKTITVTAPRKY